VTDLESQKGMKDRTESLRVGDRAPEFSLATANSVGALKVGDRISLSQLTAPGPVIVEFLRGTW
jgi:peroxiredoxin